MAKLYNTIYVANPHDKNRLELFKDFKGKLVGADIVTESDMKEYGGDGGVEDWNELCNYDPINMMDTFEQRIMEHIYNSNALFLYIENEPCKTIVPIEFTLFSMFNKPCYLIIITNRGQTKAFNEEECEKHIIVLESYLPMTGLDNVRTVYVESKEQAKNAINKILSIESPIEEMLLHEIIERCRPWDYTLSDVEPQHQIDKYRADFAYPKNKIVVELDGHDYHKTKEQRTNDAKRDRKLMEDGWKVLRFTGSEIFKDVCKCHKEIKNHLH